MGPATTKHRYLKFLAEDLLPLAFALGREGQSPNLEFLIFSNSSYLFIHDAYIIAPSYITDPVLVSHDRPN